MAAQGDSASTKEEVLEKEAEQRGDGGTYSNCRHQCPPPLLSGIADVDCSSSATIIISVLLTVCSMPVQGKSALARVLSVLGAVRRWYLAGELFCCDDTCQLFVYIPGTAHDVVENCAVGGLRLPHVERPAEAG